MCGIYKITNNINNKCYIGQSINIHRRWNAHKRQKTNSHLCRAFKKYGIENFSFTIIEECSVDELDEKEKYWIRYYDSYRNGYNETIGGDGANGCGVKLTLEQVEQIRYLLENTTLSNLQIAEQFSVSENVVSGINTGYYWKDDTLNYPIRNIEHNDSYCIDCKKPISRGAIRCIICDGIHKRMNRPNKEELLLLLQEYNGNFTKIGKLYDATDNTVRNWAKQNDLPYHTSDYRPTKKERHTLITCPVQQINKETMEIIQTFESISQAE